MDDSKLARLLSRRDEPSVLEKEALFERVLAATGQPARRRFAGFLAFAGVAAAAAAVALFVKLREPDEFASRGTTGTSPSVEVVCVKTGAAGRCEADDTVSFDVRTEGNTWYFAAFAMREDEVVWFFPQEDGESIRVEGSAKPALLGQGVRLGDRMRPGAYDIVAVFSREPLRRNDIKARLGQDLLGRSGIEVLRRPLVVEPGL